MWIAGVIVDSRPKIVLLVGDQVRDGVMTKNGRRKSRGAGHDQEETMALFIVINQYQSVNCPDLGEEMTRYFEAKAPSGNVEVYCNCSAGEHRMFFVLEAAGPAEALHTVPPGFLRSETTVVPVEQAYEFATGT